MAEQVGPSSEAGPRVSDSRLGPARLSIVEAAFTKTRRSGKREETYPMTDNQAWPITRFGDIAEFRNGLNFLSSESGNAVLMLGVSDFKYRESIGEDYDFATVTPARELAPDDFLSPNDLVFVRSNGSKSLVGRCLIYTGPALKTAISGFTIRARVIDDSVDPTYLSKVMQSPLFRSHLLEQGGGSSINNLSQAALAAFKFRLPPLPEQRKIAEILRTWDNVIEYVEFLVRSETAVFRTLRRRLFLSESHEVQLSEVSRRIMTKSDGASHTVMTISAKTGFVAQADKYRRDMAGANLANYTLLRRGEFAYNKGNSLTYPQGCIYALKVDSALVPNVYYSFRLRGDLNSSYYEHFFASGALNRQLAQRITSGVRGNGLLNLHADDFFGVKVPVPDRATQDLIADALNVGTRKIELLQRKAELLRTQKRGLMQKLLTGQVRVNVAAEIEPGGANDN